MFHVDQMVMVVSNHYSDELGSAVIKHVEPKAFVWDETIYLVRLWGADQPVRVPESNLRGIN